MPQPNLWNVCGKFDFHTWVGAYTTPFELFSLNACNHHHQLNYVKVHRYFFLVFRLSSHIWWQKSIKLLSTTFPSAATRWEHFWDWFSSQIIRYVNKRTHGSKGWLHFHQKGWNFVTYTTHTPKLSTWERKSRASLALFLSILLFRFHLFHCRRTLPIAFNPNQCRYIIVKCNEENLRCNGFR